MIIGIPKEIMHGEKRVSATPDTVSEMTGLGFKVAVEAGAGIGALCDDRAYSAAGAEILNDAAELYAISDIILKVKEPCFNDLSGKHEIDMTPEGGCIIAFLHPAAPSNHEMLHRMAAKNITALTLDGIPRITRAQSMDALTSMSTCAGYKGMLMAADALPVFIPPVFSAAGMVKPANVLVAGSGVAGLQALATAKRLGASLYVADIRPAAIEQAKSLGAKVAEVGVPESISVGEGGYANPLPSEWLIAERSALLKVLPDMDIVFLSALVPGRLAPVIITEKMVAAMAPGSVIVDIAIDQGGNCELTVPGKIIVKYGITIQGIKNIPGMLPVSATRMFAGNVCSFIKYLYSTCLEKSGAEPCFTPGALIDADDEIISGMLVTYQGRIVHKGALAAMGSGS
ncbi:MAG: NAD(P) transhydrogenase subunit alpha [Eubacteriales bacterium]|nr:NAD(P) transhydrogenase subunit alpha [Eubacteriales bacterium]